MNGAKDCSQYKRTYELKILRVFFFQHDNDMMILTPSEASEEN